MLPHPSPRSRRAHAVPLSPSVLRRAGYRALGVDYKSGGFRLDAIMHGPAVGVGIRF
jgi:hypothetical protein